MIKIIRLSTMFLLMLFLTHAVHAKSPATKQQPEKTRNIDGPTRNETIQFILAKLHNDPESSGQDVWEYSIDNDNILHKIQTSGHNVGFRISTDLNEIESLDTHETLSSSKGKLFYIKAYCRNGDNCRTSKPVHGEDPMAWNYDEIYFVSKDTSERVCKAFKHLKELAGGRKEAF